jgi:hypothetical protein
MSQTLTNVQYAEALSLQQYIDNRDGNMCVCLRSITYTIGWYNVDKGESIFWRDASNYAGLYQSYWATQ